jgi:ketosteroid isomerase-like protein
MSQENVEVVRRSFEVWNAGDMDALREMQDPGIIWRGPEGWPEPGPYAGREAVMRQVNQLASISPELGKAVAPHAERLARLLLREPEHPTPLTRQRHRAALASD